MKITITATRHCLYRVLSWALLVVSVAVPAPLSAWPGGEVSFRASYETRFQVSPAPPILNITVQGEGHALQMGRSETFTNNQVVNLMTGAATATYTVIAANGDTVVFESTFQTVTSSTGATFDGTYEITGGTGRFAGATGNGTVTGSAQFTGENVGVGEFTFEGTISSPGRR